jgi:hypothetical protein
MNEPEIGIPAAPALVSDFNLLAGDFYKATATAIAPVAINQISCRAYSGHSERIPARKIFPNWHLVNSSNRWDLAT